ncbi:hypothetical protein GIB67_031869 [Kingdonia uniflora]|uniref:HMA domain-containing protein n=1 Tax=Kingdonia uniflora TaxID=39325 RepID=A0A7J7L4Q3_9MAGN|nr:hypothetical protein GIB67_031869 [Kingdonia uniflora]
MAPSLRDLQLTPLSNTRKHLQVDDLEDVRLLDSYEERRVVIDDEEAEEEKGLRGIQVRVTGMTCAACSTSVEGAISGINGVVRASVALLQNKADVVFDPKLVKGGVDLVFGVFYVEFLISINEVMRKL